MRMDKGTIFSLVLVMSIIILLAALAAVVKAGPTQTSTATFMTAGDTYNSGSTNTDFTLTMGNVGSTGTHTLSGTWKVQKEKSIDQGETFRFDETTCTYTNKLRRITQTSTYHYDHSYTIDLGRWGNMPVDVFMLDNPLTDYHINTIHNDNNVDVALYRDDQLYFNLRPA